MSKSGQRWKQAHTPGYQYDFDWQAMSQPKHSDREATDDERRAAREAGGLPLAAREADKTMAAALEGHAALVDRAAQVVEDRQVGLYGYVTAPADRRLLAKMSDPDLEHVIRLNTGG